MEYTFTSESVSEGHPDKVADYISDSILDAHIQGDPESRVACETLCKGDQVVLAGEITTTAIVDYGAVVRQAVRDVGYTDSSEPFCSDTLQLELMLSVQSSEIKRGVDGGGAGDQGIMFGFATDETPELMPLPILLAHRLNLELAGARQREKVDWLRPDSKTQVSCVYNPEGPVRVSDVLVSTQHKEGTQQDVIRAFLSETILPQALGDWWSPDVHLQVNPTGSFAQGGPSVDAGLTGRKIIVDTYGGAARHGGGAFSGKDPSKVDRSAAYFCRFVARHLVQTGICRKAEIQVAYAIGVEDPMSIWVDTFGTGDQTGANAFVREFDFRPRAIIERLDLKAPIYKQTTNYGHFGRPGLPWED